MGPRNFCTLPVLCLLFITIGALGSPSTNHTNGVSMARFFRKGTPVRSVDGLSDPEQHARTLTRRKPTRRGTAQRRAPSDLPPVPHTVSVGVVTAGEIPFPVGNLLFTDDFKWVLTNTPGSLITYTASPSWTSRDQQRLDFVPIAEVLWPLFGASQCDPAAGMDLRPGSSDTVCLANIDNPGTLPDSKPVIISNSIGTGGLVHTTAVETDIWTIDYTTGQATPKWINADGTSFTCFVLCDPASGEVFITGDIIATIARLQRVLIAINLIFTEIG